MVKSKVRAIRSIWVALNGRPLFSRLLAMMSFSLSKDWLLRISTISSTQVSETVEGSLMKGVEGVEGVSGVGCVGKVGCAVLGLWKRLWG